MPAPTADEVEQAVKLEEVRFSAEPFRRLGGLTLPIAPRLTLIAGRNGVGKSTLLALIANASGLSRGKAMASYFGKLPQANLHEIVQLSKARDFVEDEQKKPNVFLKYRFEGAEFEKKCNVTARSGEELRIVPRNDPKGPKNLGTFVVPADGKVPIPTIYLGMTRMLPIGEAEPGTLQQAKTPPDLNDAKFLDSFTKRIINTGSNEIEPEITTQWVKGTTKFSLHPPYAGYDSTAISLGQDSLSSIATALASFQKLMRDMPNYPGGILVIDEIDAGFHPQAQVQLLKELKSEARRLKLQIVATTHSLTMLSEAHKEMLLVPDASRRLDGIVYLQGGNPVQLLDISTYDDIEADMLLALRRPRDQPSIKVYVEDDEAALFLNAILTPSRLKGISKRLDRKIKIISAHVGCANLVGLVKADEYFKTVVIVLDADTTNVKTGNAQNIVRLPADSRVTVKQSPEAIVESMSTALVSDATAYPKTRQLLAKSMHSTDHIQTWILNLQDQETAPVATVALDREFAKKWFGRRLDSIKSLQLIEGWVADNKKVCDEFLIRFETAVSAVSGGKAPAASSVRKTNPKHA